MENNNGAFSLNGNSGTASGSYTETMRPHFWFFTMANDGCTPVFCEYTLTLTQADGGQLSFDEIGMPSTYGVFWLIYLVGGGVHVFLHYVRRPRFAPLLVLLLTGSLMLQLLSLTAHMIDWAQVSSRGVGLPFFEVTGGLFHLGAVFALWILAGLAANGFGITTFSLASRDNMKGESGGTGGLLPLARSLLGRLPQWVFASQACRQLWPMRAQHMGDALHRGWLAAARVYCGCPFATQSLARQLRRRGRLDFAAISADADAATTAAAAVPPPLTLLTPHLLRTPH